MSEIEIPVLLLTGYLGSGKTTLLNRILTNRKGIRFAVIVNDIGEVNIDATLIQQGGIVGQDDDSLVALQNGCICCTLQMDLVQQLHDIVSTGRFDYIVIEASGICEPGPIAQTICSIPQLDPRFQRDGLAKLDCIATVVDALRMRDEFGNGEGLMHVTPGETDIENLVIQQIEFCNIVLLNKSDMVSGDDLLRIRHIIRALQPHARIINCNYGDVDLDEILNTEMFDFESVATSARWIQEIEGHHGDEMINDEEINDDDDDHEHEHHHHDHEEHEHEHHHHHHDHEHHHHDDDDDDDDDICPECGHHHHHGDGEECHCGCHHHHHGKGGHAEEYGISTFVWYRREPMNLGLFDHFVARKWPRSIIRAKGICYFHGEEDKCYLFEQAGQQVSLQSAGQWYATMPQDELEQMLDNSESLRRDWDEHYGDRMQKLVFIGQNMDQEAIIDALNACLYNG